jgi:hypothetical protein
MTRDSTFPYLSVTDGQTCIGWVRSHVRGFEAVSASGEVSLGCFATRDAAIKAIMESPIPASSS